MMPSHESGSARPPFARSGGSSVWASVPVRIYSVLAVACLLVIACYTVGRAHTSSDGALTTLHTASGSSLASTPTPTPTPATVVELQSRSSRRRSSRGRRHESDEERSTEHGSGGQVRGEEEEEAEQAPTPSAVGRRRPIEDRTDVPASHDKTTEDDSGVNDEDVFDEGHQQSIAEMYGDFSISAKRARRAEEGRLARRQPEAAWIEPDANDPHSYPGMVPNEGPGSYDYAITIDCGSKGSRVHIYKWLHRHSPTSIPPFSPLFTKHAWSQKVTPGISTFADAPELVIASMASLLEFARNSLSAFRYKWNRTPVYLKATAGMRLVKNLPSRDRIMETIRTFLSDRTKNPFYFERTMARVISGEEEGVYGWMTANYLSGTLTHATSATAYGALDMGGASTQITFRPPFDVLSNYFPLRIQQEKIRLYSHSFLNFGIERALERVNDRLIELGGNGTTAAAAAAAAADTTTQATSPESVRPSVEPAGSSGFLGIRDGVRVFRHPCFPLGFSFTYVYVRNLDLAASYSGIAQRGAAVGDNEDGADLSPITTYSEANAQREMVQFEGSQNFANCSAITWQLLHKRGACFDNTCSFNGIYQPRFGNTTFLAFSEFAKVVTGDLGLGRNATLKEIDVQTRKICGWNWQKLQDTYRYAKIDSLSKLCFNARYIFTVLYKGFGFPYEGNNLRFVTDILELDLSWALGSTLYEANAMPFDLDGPHGETFKYELGGDSAPNAKTNTAGSTAAATAAAPAEKGDAREDRRAGATTSERPVAGRKDPHLDQDDDDALTDDDTSSSRSSSGIKLSKRQRRAEAKRTKREDREDRKRWRREQKRRGDGDREDGRSQELSHAEYSHQQHEEEPRLQQQQRQHSQQDDYMRDDSSSSKDSRRLGSGRSRKSDDDVDDGADVAAASPARADGWATPSVWGVVGFLLSGWLVTAVAWFLSIRQMRGSYEVIES